MRSVMMALLVSVPSLAAQEAARPRTPEEQYEALLMEYEAASETWSERYDPESADTDFVERYEEWPAWEFAPRFLGLAERNPDDPAAFAAFVWIVELGPQVGQDDQRLVPHYERALGLLAKDHLEDERLGRVCKLLSLGCSPAAEDFLRVVLEKAPDRDVGGRACLGLAECLVTRRKVAQRPWFDSQEQSSFQKFLATRTDPAYFDYIRATDLEASLDEAERLFERVIEEYSDVPAMLSNGSYYDDARKLADVAGSELYEIRNLSLGMVAPEIEGEDIDGEPMRLSDYRGEVVALVSWATWCGPCMGMIPHERELVGRLEGKPFVLLGINGDEDRDRVKEVMRDEGITWRSWWNGGPEGPISKRLNLRAWPTIYVLDADGVIRYKQIRGEELDEAIETLLDEMEAEDAPEP